METTATSLRNAADAGGQAETVPARSGFFLPIFTLAQRELVRFLRQRNRVVGALGQPLIFWLLFGAAFQSSFKPSDESGMNYQEFFFPGTVVMILLFTAIFSTISIIEDRREGFLQSVLVAPISQLSMVMGKILGGSLLAVMQGLLFFTVAFYLRIPLDAVIVLEALAVMFLIAFALTGLGFVIAWRMDSTQGFHAIMSVFLLPMWMLAGTLFPANKAHPILAWMITLNPLTYGVAAFRQILYPGRAFAGLPSLQLSLAVTVLFAVAMTFAAAFIARGRTTGDLH